MRRQRELVSTLIFISFAGVVAGCGKNSDDAQASVGAGGKGAGGASGGSNANGGSDAASVEAGTFDTSGGPTDPIPTKPLEWVWVPFPGAKCRDGSTAGIEVKANPDSDKLMIFLQGGGSCWNTYECGVNAATFVPPTNIVHTGGVFDANPANPVKDWNMVFVPYCTGDVHAGNNPDFDLGNGMGPQQFVGYANMEHFLDRIVPTFPNVTTVLHTGVSAGGYGALFTVELVAKKFPSSVDVVLVADSSPVASLAYLPACIQHRKWTTWGFDKTFLQECGADCPDPDDYGLSYLKHLAKTYPARRSGLIEAIADATISQKWGYTASDCDIDITQAPAPMDAAMFEAALLDARAQITALVPDGGTANFGTFYPQGTEHGWLELGTLYTGTAGDELLVDWIGAIVNGAAPTNAGP